MSAGNFDDLSGEHSGLLAGQKQNGFRDVLGLDQLARDKLYPEYGFAKHKGYPTKQHLEAIKEYGILDLHHRKSYSPVQNEALKGNFNKNEIK